MVLTLPNEFLIEKKLEMDEGNVLHEKHKEEHEKIMAPHNLVHIVKHKLERDRNVKLEFKEDQLQKHDFCPL